MKPLIGSNKSQVVADIPEVKSIIEGVTVCWGCLSETCMIRKRMSVKLTGKKMINKSHYLKDAPVIWFGLVWVGLV